MIDNIVKFESKVDDGHFDDDDDLMVLSGRECIDALDPNDPRVTAYFARLLYLSLSNIDYAKTTPGIFWATFDKPNDKAEIKKWLDSSIQKLTEIKEGIPK
jgi:hypothetical protein